MNTKHPRLDEVVAADDPDRSRLQAAHDLLLAAGAPPELPPRLEEPPAEPNATALTLPRRRSTLIGAVAVVASVLFGLGYAIGGRDNPTRPVQTIAMTGAKGAEATIDVLARDSAGNWPIRLGVSGLPSLLAGSTYTLWLTKGGNLAEPCGAFTVAAGTTEVALNAPYPVASFDGWAIVRSGTTRPFLARTAST